LRLALCQFNLALTTSSNSANALIIHYTANDQVLQPDELVLVDAGCEYQYVFFLLTRPLHTPDGQRCDLLVDMRRILVSSVKRTLSILISVIPLARTWPVSGTFTSPQRDLYQVKTRSIRLLAHGLMLNRVW
jgi:hypothetical protein